MRGRALSLPALEPVLGPLGEAALATGDGVLARVWLIGPGDSCVSCPMRPECASQTRCLHLMASAGLTTRVDGPFRRFPIGAREVGRIPVSGEPFVATDNLAELGLAEHTWLSNHRIRSFAALPLEYGGHSIGVVAVFSRGALDPRELRALSMTARLGALALGHLKAFQELAGERNRLAARSARAGARAAADRSAQLAEPFLRPLAETERESIERVLAHTGGRVSGPRGAAAILGLKPTTLFSRMKKLGVHRMPR